MARQQPFPGMEIHATLLSNLLNRDFLRPLDGRLATAWTVILAVMVGVLFMRVGRQWVALPLIALVLAGAVGAAFFVFRTRLLWVPIVEPLAAGSLSLVLAALLSYQIEGRRRREVRSVFSRYLAPEVVRELLADPDRIGLGGKEVEATVFFSDVREFTRISEKLPPQVLVGYLNQYFDAASQALLSHKALIDKYIGDAIMAVFGAPAEDPGHARNACLAALAIAEQDDRRPVAIRSPCVLHPHGAQLGAPGGRQRWFPLAPGVHRHRRQREPSLAPGKREQASTERRS